MRALLCLGVLTIVVTCVKGWGRILSDNSLGYNSWIPARRSWGCGRNRDICYQSSQCCRGYYCASIDPNDSKPGVCRAWRQEPDTCLGDEDCQAGHTCVPLGQVGSVRLGKCTKVKPSHRRGTMGDECTDSGDCADGLCCQLVRAFRRGPVKMCHQVSAFSKCIKAGQRVENMKDRR